MGNSNEHLDQDKDIPDTTRNRRRRSLGNCPPGFECLIDINKLMIYQQIEPLEILTGFETSNKYIIKSGREVLYYAKEYSNCGNRNLCHSYRQFDMEIYDNYQNQVIHLHRPLACNSCWFPCCLQYMEVTSHPVRLIGTVEQKWTILMPAFTICDPVGEVVLRIEGPCPTWVWCASELDFLVKSADGSRQIGKITKNWTGFGRELFMDADNFEISFPLSLDVKMKAVMLGASFLIDFMYFENR